MTFIKINDDMINLGSVLRMRYLREADRHGNVRPTLEFIFQAIGTGNGPVTHTRVFVGDVAESAWRLLAFGVIPAGSDRDAVKLVHIGQ